MVEDATQAVVATQVQGVERSFVRPDERVRISRQYDLEPDSRWDIYRLSRDTDAFIFSSNPLWAEADLRFDDGPVYWDYAGQPDIVKVMGKIA